MFDAAGRGVGPRLDRDLDAGRHRIEWATAGWPPGTYDARLRWNGGEETRRFVRVR